MKRVFTSLVKYVFVCALLFLSIVLNASVQSIDKASNKLYNITGDCRAIKGYNPVAYFTENIVRVDKKS